MWRSIRTRKDRHMTKNWQPHSWRSHEARQLPTYSDDAALAGWVGSIWQARGDRYSELRGTQAAADLQKIEMSYIGG